MSVTIFFTGLSGSGKTTLAKALAEDLYYTYNIDVTLLDGDSVRKILSSELGFSKKHRDLNVIRLGWVAAEINRHGGFAICSAIAPYDYTRKGVRKLVERYGSFVLVHLSTTVGKCIERDVKGLYKKALNGEIEKFTGISDPYEPPDDADITIDTAKCTVREAVDKVMYHLDWLTK